MKNSVSKIQLDSATFGLKCIEAHTERMVRIVQSFLRTEARGEPSTRLDMRDPARQEITMEVEEAKGDCRDNRLPNSSLSERAVIK